MYRKSIIGSYECVDDQGVDVLNRYYTTKMIYQLRTFFLLKIFIFETFGL